MRNIAAFIGVTTGAIYRYYVDKKAFFDALVAGPPEKFLMNIKHTAKTFKNRSLINSIQRYRSSPISLTEKQKCL